MAHREDGILLHCEALVNTPLRRGQLAVDGYGSLYNRLSRSLACHPWLVRVKA
jgi:hypothetical protein